MVTALMIAIILPVLFLDGTKALLTCKTTNPCPPVTLNAPNGQFSSQNYPNNYSVDATCVFQINVPVGHIIKVTFSDFILEPGDQTDCTGDAQGARLEFTNVGLDDRRALPFKLCGQNIPDPVYSNTNSMQITLCTGNNGRKGFNASYVAIPEQELCPTLANLNDSAGEISSIYYPRKYPASETCTWQINADKGKHIQLVTSSINLPLCSNCNCDSLEVRHGVEVDGKTGKICGDKTSKTFYSTFESLWVRFISDSDQAFVHNGFMATYKEINYMPPVCPSDPIPLSGNGTIRSPSFPVDEYPITTNCLWLITVPEGKRVKLDFHIFAFDTGCDCPTQDCGSVTLYDGNSDTSPLLGKFCGTTKPPSVVSGGQHMLVVFRSNFKRERGFNATYMETLSSSTTTSTSALSSSSVAVTMTPEQTTRQTTTSLSSSSVAVTMTPEQTTRQTTTSSGCQISISLLASLVTMLAAFHWP